MENVSNDYIENAVIDLVELFGVKNENDIDYFHLVRLVRENKLEECVQKIALILGLPVKIDLSYVTESYGSNGRIFYGNKEDQFESSDLVKTDSVGRGVDGIVAQVSIPPNIPFFGSPRLNGYNVKVKVSSNSTKHPETFVFLIFHELSHILLATIGSKHAHNEIFTDITPLVLGFFDIAKMGRKSVETTYGPGVLGTTTTTRTTSYGYLDDEQFNTAGRKIDELVKMFLPLKDELRFKTEIFEQKEQLMQKYVKLFKELLSYFSKNNDIKIHSSDSKHIVEFFNPIFFDDTDALITKNTDRIEKLKKYHSGFTRFTDHNKDIIQKNIQNTSAFIKDLDDKISSIKNDIKLLNKYYIAHNKLREHRAFLDLENEENTQNRKNRTHKTKTYRSKHSYSSSGSKMSTKSLLFILFIGIIFVIIVASNGSNTSSTDPVSGNTTPDTSNCTSPQNGQTFASLSNGTQISRNPSFFDGEGELTITNGTDDDAVIKIINSRTNTSVKEYYVRAHNGYTIRSIPDGTYNLLFSLGKNWDATINKFITCKSFSKFDDSFTFTTTTQKYMTYKISLNPVSGGTATTSNLNENEFEKY